MSHTGPEIVISAAQRALDFDNKVPFLTHTPYGVATISRLLKIIGHFCKRALQKRRYSAKETYNFKEPTNRSRSICACHQSI